MLSNKKSWFIFYLNFLPRLLFAPLLKWNCLAAFFVKQLRSSFLLRSLKFSGARKRSKSCQFHAFILVDAISTRCEKHFAPKFANITLFESCSFVLTFLKHCDLFHAKNSTLRLVCGGWNEDIQKAIKVANLTPDFILSPLFKSARSEESILQLSPSAFFVRILAWKFKFFGGKWFISKAVEKT